MTTMAIFAYSLECVRELCVRRVEVLQYGGTNTNVSAKRVVSCNLEKTANANKWVTLKNKENQVKHVLENTRHT